MRAGPKPARCVARRTRTSMRATTRSACARRMRTAPGARTVCRSPCTSARRRGTPRSLVPHTWRSHSCCSAYLWRRQQLKRERALRYSRELEHTVRDAHPRAGRAQSAAAGAQPREERFRRAHESRAAHADERRARHDVRCCSIPGSMPRSGASPKPFIARPTRCSRSSTTCSTSRRSRRAACSSIRSSAIWSSWWSRPRKCSRRARRPRASRCCAIRRRSRCRACASTPFVCARCSSISAATP